MQRNIKIKKQRTIFNSLPLRFLLLCFFISCLLVVSSCSVSEENIKVTGTIHYIGLEGGFWGITVEDGRKFDPINLPEGFKKEALKVHVTLRPRDELAGTHMWGQMVEIVEIREIKK